MGVEDALGVGVERLEERVASPHSPRQTVNASNRTKTGCTCTHLVDTWLSPRTRLVSESKGWRSELRRCAEAASVRVAALGYLCNVCLRLGLCEYLGAKGT